MAVTLRILQIRHGERVAMVTVKACHIECQYADARFIFKLPPACRRVAVVKTHKVIFQVRVMVFFTELC